MHKVEQPDRIAAAEMICALDGMTERYHIICRGDGDDFVEVQAFARHRTEGHEQGKREEAKHEQ